MFLLELLGVSVFSLGFPNWFQFGSFIVYGIPAGFQWLGRVLVLEEGYPKRATFLGLRSG